MSVPDTGAAVFRPALIIAGMHRSGTSLTAALCQTAGLFIGHRLMPGYPGNERGHFEDMDFVGIHQRSLVANGLVDTGFDIGTASLSVPVAERDVARSLLEERRALGVHWGWKDPRSVLFLPFWAEAIPEAKFLFVFRRPCEVVDSLFRRNSDVDRIFRGDPLRAVLLWCRYNTAIRDFARTHADRVLVREIRQIVASPAALVADMGRELGIPLLEPQPVYEPGRLTTGLPASRESLVALAAPETQILYDDLRGLAGSWEPPGQGAEGPMADWPQAFAEWVEEAARPRQSGRTHP